MHPPNLSGLSISSTPKQREFPERFDLDKDPYWVAKEEIAITARKCLLKDYDFAWDGVESELAQRVPPPGPEDTIFQVSVSGIGAPEPRMEMADWLAGQIQAALMTFFKKPNALEDPIMIDYVDQCTRDLSETILIWRTASDTQRAEIGNWNEVNDVVSAALNRDRDGPYIKAVTSTGTDLYERLPRSAVLDLPGSHFLKRVNSAPNRPA